MTELMVLETVVTLVFRIAMKSEAKMDGQKSRAIRMAIEKNSRWPKFRTEISRIDAARITMKAGILIAAVNAIEVEKYRAILSGSCRPQEAPMKRRIPIGTPSEKTLTTRLSNDRIAETEPTTAGGTNREASIQYRKPTMLKIATPRNSQKLPLIMP